MAKTQRDINLQAQIKNLSAQLLEKDLPDSEIIEMIAGAVGISLRTASEHFRAFKSQKKLDSFDINLNKCYEHKFSNWYSTPGGLARECMNCHVVESKKS